jgi:hypothetical protein
MKGFKFQPVKWMTLILGILGGVVADNRTTPVADPKTTIDGTTVPLVPKPSAIPADATSPVPDPQR